MHLPSYVSYKTSVTSVNIMEVPCNVVATFVLVLQEAHPKKTEVVYFLESFWNSGQLNVPQCQWSNHIIA